MTTVAKIIVSVSSGLLLVLLILLAVWFIQSRGLSDIVTNPTPSVSPATVAQTSPVGSPTPRILQELPLCPIEQTTIGMVRALQDPASLCRLILVQPDGLEQLAAHADKFTNLKSLEASHGQYRSVPSEIGTISSLIMINLNDNYLTTLPDSISQLNNLSLLLLKRNAFSETERERIKNLTDAIIGF